MTQLVLKEGKQIVLTDSYLPDFNAAFGVIVPGTDVKHFIMSDKYIRRFTEPSDYLVVSLFDFTRKNIQFRRENITLKEFISWCLKSGMKVYEFSSPQEMLKWAISTK